jgi:hypothetical protein
MRTNRHRFVLSAILALFSFVMCEVTVSSENITLALITKIIQEVMKKPDSTNDWTKASKGEILIAGDHVRTGKKSLAIVKFTDNSIVRLRELSELQLNAEGARGSLVRSAQLTGGAVGFDVKKQQENNLFRLTSPTSVASIRGTKGKWSGGKGNDTLVVTEGLINLLNNVSNKNLDIPAGFIGFSNSDGSLSSRKATDDELADASSAANGGSPNELKFEMQDSQGNKRELRLKYNKQ